MTTLVHVEAPAPGVGMVLLDNPPKNFASYALLQALHDAIGEVKGSGARVVVLASDVPGYLMAHAWLPDVLNAYEHPEAITGNPLLWRMVAHELERGDMISISCNHGQAWGGGAELSWACSLRTAGESATYAQIESILGVIPGGGGTARLARLVGQSKALEILLTGEPMTAAQLAELGVVNKVFPDDELRERTIEWAAMIATRPRRALLACKRGVLQTWDLDMENALRLEGYIFNSCMRPETLEIMRRVQDGYDRGEDSWSVYGLSRGNARPV
jgi:enoyl-CoA hydratase